MKTLEHTSNKTVRSTFIAQTPFLSTWMKITNPQRLALVNIAAYPRE